jgi:hypothetical protein
MSEEQFQQLMIRVGGQSQARIPRHFTQCSARFNGTRSAAAVEEFVTAATIYKKVEGISDEDALEGLPLLLTGEANPWWNGIKSNVSTWKEDLEMKMPSLIIPLADNDARDYQPPTSRITQPAIHDGRSVWNVYQAQGSSDYIMQDAIGALMDYEMESSSGYDSPIRIHLATLHLRPVEGASLPKIEKKTTQRPAGPARRVICENGTSDPLRREPYRHRRQHPDSFSAVSTHSG